VIEALSRFVEALREEGIGASPAEAVDAARAIEEIGLEKRERFRGALRACLVKHREELPVFDRLFDRFFAPPARAPRLRRKGIPGGAGMGGKRQTRSNGEPGSPPTRRAEPRLPNRSEESGRTAAASSLRASGQPRGQRRDRRLLEPIPASAVRRIVVVRSRTGRGKAPGERAPDPLEREFRGVWTTEEERRLAELVPRLVAQLKGGRSRRLRRARRGRFWARQLFRRSAGRDGVPFVLPYRERRPERVRVVLLVDVSWSTARAAGYFLSIATHLLQLGRRHRVILFVDRPVDATEVLAEWARGGVDLGGAPRSGSPRGRAVPGEGIVRAGVSFARLLGSLRGLNLDAPSDYGRAFHGLLRSRARPRGRDTILVVLGDGRTNRFDPLPWVLEEIARDCRAVLWLVPEPRSRWGEGDSRLPAYLPHVDMLVEASDLRGLARGVSELLRRL
jgi:hypothetical protein